MKIQADVDKQQHLMSFKQRHSCPGMAYRQCPSGFALVATVSMMVLMTLVALGMLSLSTIEQRSSGNGDEAMRTAQANARMALMIALGELQKAAGPDTRSTATGDLVIPASQNNHHNRRNWTGVWRTDNYDQRTPEAAKTFVTWLASNRDGGLSTEADITDYVFQDPHVILEAGDTSDDNEINDVIVDKVEVDTVGGNSSYYAYWVSDEGTKASFAWNQASHGNDTASQDAARLSASPGFDYGVFSSTAGSPYSLPSYPLNGSDTLLAQNGKILSLGSISLAAGSTSPADTWIKKHYHDMTVASYGVLADMKLGGLKRDLSLAFEMDGEADYGTDENGDATTKPRPTKFDQQVGEFVAGSDRLSAPNPKRADDPAFYPNNDIKERYVYRNTSDDGSWFAAGIDQYSAGSFEGVSRGTTWWNLRDFSQLYKRLRTTTNGYALSARAMYPNNLLNNFNISGLTGLSWNYRPENSQFSQRLSWLPINYVPYPSRGNYAPVLIGTSFFFSVKNHAGNLALVLEPVFKVWNPYNVTITAKKYGIGSFAFKVPGVFSLRVNRDNGSGVFQQAFYGTFTIAELLDQGAYTPMHFLMDDLTLAPGEVALLSTPDHLIYDTATKKREMSLRKGLNMNDTSGVVITDLLQRSPKRRGAWPLQNTDKIEYAYHNSIILSATDGATLGISEFYLDTRLYPSDINVGSIGYSAGDQLQHTTLFLHSQGVDANGDPILGKIAEGYEVKKSLFASESNLITSGWFPYIGGEAASLLTTKKTFAAMSLLNRAGIDARSSVQDPGLIDKIGHMEAYTHFNPADAITHQISREAVINKMVTMVCKEGGYNAIRSALGFDYPFGAGQTNNGYYGNSYDSVNNGSTHFQLKSIPTRPMHSLLELRGAATAVHSNEPFSPLGESFANPFVAPSGIFDNYELNGNQNIRPSIADQSWLFNDALFDRYFFSGIAPKFTIGSAGYAPASGASINATLTDFYGSDYKAADANNVLMPHIPQSVDPGDIITALDAADGYKKMGAYSLINGQFNVNSTSVRAWAALLMANRDVDVAYADSSSSDDDPGIPFPGSNSSIIGLNAKTGWVGLSRLLETDIWDDKDTPDDTSDDTGLAVEIVKEVKKRGPFMSLADFVNRRPGGSNDTDKRGALQAAIDNAGIYGDFHTSISAEDTNYANLTYFNHTDIVKTSTGNAGDITQAKVLLTIAPRLNARSDTFKIRAYGEVKNSAGAIIAHATCEAVVQRLPEYVNSDDDPWEDSMKDPLPMTTLVPRTAADGFDASNAQYGRRFKVVRFRWLAEPEI
jgi:hypothetical protein